MFASQVARNSLFEKPGEREVTPPLSPTAPVANADGVQEDGKEEDSG